MRLGIATANNIFKLYDVETDKALDGTVSIDLPDVGLETVEYKGAGVIGTINVPLIGLMNALEATINVAKIYGALTDYMQVGVTKTLDLRNDVSVISGHGTIRVPERLVMRGPLSGAPLGSVEQGSASDSSIVMQVYYMQYFLDGDMVMEWDVMKAIYTVNGVDLLADTRRNIGM
jgi:P2 family phage contractile tail tube protein